MGISVADASQHGGGDASLGTGGLRDWGKARSNVMPGRRPERNTGLTPSDMSRTAKGPQEAASHLSPAVVKLRVADGKRLR